VLVALDARVIAVGPRGERTIDAAQFFTGMMTTALADDEIVSAVTIPALAQGEGSAYMKFVHPASRYAVVGVAAAVKLADGVCVSVRVAVGGLVPHAIRVPSVERALSGQRADQQALATAAAGVADDLGHDVSGDIFASAEYRRAMAPVYVKRALAAAVARASA
jgi:carbon-monoxide dehydrogenase medium subunit